VSTVPCKRTIHKIVENFQKRGSRLEGGKKKLIVTEEKFHILALE